MFIYIHIPFCKSICPYCDFPKFLYDKKYIIKYLDILKSEILERYKGELVKSIYIGGGTPTSLDYDELEYLLDITKLFKRDKNVEFSVESNVECLDIDKIKLLKKYDVNRVSLGIQSFDYNNIKELGRNHTKENSVEIIKLLKIEGISNISIDLMYGVNSNIEVVEKDLEMFLSLDIPHVSYYGLIIEPHTIFEINNKEYIRDDIEYEMYKRIENILGTKGYVHYEISNYSRLGYESIHNLNYWNNGSYYGFGLGAVSYLDNYRISNTKNLTKYLEGNYYYDKDYENLDKRISNSIILGLRKINGIDIKEFNKRYHTDLLNLYNIKKLIREKKLIVDSGFLYINSKYLYISNDILINFI